MSLIQHDPSKEISSTQSREWLLADEKSEETLEETTPTHGERQNRRLSARLWMCQILFFLVSSLLFIHGILNSQHCKLQNGVATWYDRHVSNERVWHRFEEENSAIYRHPGPAADAAWDRLLKYRPFRIDETQFEEIEAPRYAVQYPADQGGGYRANLGVFHHLHCVKLLWQYTHRDYYQTREPWFFADSDEMLHTHLDHCADVVRQALMCKPDLSLETFHETNDPELPDRNHDIKRSCRNYEQVLDWVKAQPRTE